MRRLALLPVALVASVAIVSGAHAGQADISANGDVLMLDAALSPPITSSATVAQPVTLEIHTLFGNIYGNPTGSESGELTFGMPSGTKFNGKSFTACPLPTTDAQLGDSSRCPAASQVGSGTATADARKINFGSRLEGTVKVFNGAPHKGKRTIFLHASIDAAGTKVPAEITLDVVGNKLVEFDYADRPRGTASFDLTRVDVKIGKTIKVKGKSVSLLVAPKTCKRTWAFSLLVQRNSSSQTANDTAPCQLVK